MVGLRVYLFENAALELLGCRNVDLEIINLRKRHEENSTIPFTDALRARFGRVHCAGSPE